MDPRSTSSVPYPKHICKDWIWHLTSQMEPYFINAPNHLELCSPVLFQCSRVARADRTRTVQAWKTFVYSCHFTCENKSQRTVYWAPVELTSHQRSHHHISLWPHLQSLERGWWGGKPAAVFQEINLYPCSDQSWLSERIKLSKLLLLGRSAALNPGEKLHNGAV